MPDYGLDIKTGALAEGDREWVPVMKNSYVRLRFPDEISALAYKDALTKHQRALEVRLVLLPAVSHQLSGA